MFKKAFSALLNLLFPPVCAHCKKEGDFLCLDCIKGLDSKKIHLSKKIDSTKFKFLDGVIYAFDYSKNPAIKSAISQFKYKFNQELSNYFGCFLMQKINELNMTKGRPIVLIPVPLHKRRLAERGFNQSEILCRSLKKEGDHIFIHPILTRGRYTSQQAKLSKNLRHQNLRGAFMLKAKDLFYWQKGSICFLVDDVCTTGSTLEACAEVLKDNGVKKVYGLVVARAFKN